MNVAEMLAPVQNMKIERTAEAQRYIVSARRTTGQGLVDWGVLPGLFLWSWAGNMGVPTSAIKAFDCSSSHIQALLGFPCSKHRCRCTLKVCVQALFPVVPKPQQRAFSWGFCGCSTFSPSLRSLHISSSDHGSEENV